MAWIAPVLSIAGGLMGQEQARGSQAEANRLSQQQIQAWQNLALPQLKDLNLERYTRAGDMNPNLEAAEQLSMADQLQNVNLDPRLKNAQMSALDMLQKIGQTGYTPEQKAQLQAIRQQTEADNTARLQAMLQQQDARGVGSSDMALAMRALESQGAANRQATDVSNTAATGFRQALEAMSQGGQLAGQMENADYSRQAQLAEAQRNREMANLAQRANVQQRNVGAKNAAQMFNLEQAQNIANQNTGLAGEENRYNAYGREQMAFDAGARRAGGMSGAAGSAANQAQQNAANTRGMWSQIGTGAGQLAGSYFAPETTKKKNSTTRTAPEE